MLDRPLQLLDRDQYLAQYSINFCFARVEACYRSNGLLIVEDEPEANTLISLASVQAGRNSAITSTMSSGPSFAARNLSLPILSVHPLLLQWLGRCHQVRLG